MLNGFSACFIKMLKIFNSDGYQTPKPAITETNPCIIHNVSIATFCMGFIYNLPTDAIRLHFQYRGFYGVIQLNSTDVYIILTSGGVCVGGECSHSEFILNLSKRILPYLTQ